MNYHFSLLILFLCFSVTLGAQDIGLQAGFVLSNVKSPKIIAPNGDVPEIDHQVSFAVNAYLGLMTDRKVSISAEPGYIVKGAYWENYAHTESDNYRLRLHYLQIPVLANINIYKKFFVSLGPEIAYLLNAAVDPEGGIADNFYDNKIEFSALLGLGYKINEHLYIGGRYNLGLSPISTITFFDFSGNAEKTESEYNRYAQIFLRYIL